jgi:hypothetical protein
MKLKPKIIARVLREEILGRMGKSARNSQDKVTKIQLKRARKMLLKYKTITIQTSYRLEINSSNHRSKIAQNLSLKVF